MVTWRFGVLSFLVFCLSQASGSDSTIIPGQDQNDNMNVENQSKSDDSTKTQDRSINENNRDFPEIQNQPTVSENRLTNEDLSVNKAQAQNNADFYDPPVQHEATRDKKYNTDQLEHSQDHGFENAPSNSASEQKESNVGNQEEDSDIEHTEKEKNSVVMKKLKDIEKLVSQPEGQKPKKNSGSSNVGQKRADEPNKNIEKTLEDLRKTLGEDVAEILTGEKFHAPFIDSAIKIALAQKATKELTKPITDESSKKSTELSEDALNKTAESVSDASALAKELASVLLEINSLATQAKTEKTNTAKLAKTLLSLHQTLKSKSANIEQTIAAFNSLVVASVNLGEANAKAIGTIANANSTPPNLKDYLIADKNLLAFFFNEIASSCKSCLEALNMLSGLIINCQKLLTKFSEEQTANNAMQLTKN